jgi:hypothetical protein
MLALLTLAIIAFSICQIYGWAFAHKPPLDQPPQYRKAKRFLNVLSAVLILLAAISLAVDDEWGWAAVLVLGSLIVAYLVHGLAYRRAVIDMSLSTDPQTGEYIFGSTPQERMERAKLWIDSGGF